MFTIFSLISDLLWPAIIIIAIYAFINFKSGDRLSSFPVVEDSAKSNLKEYIISQFFLVFSLIFLTFFLVALNRYCKTPFSNLSIILVMSLFGLTVSYYYRLIYLFIISIVSGVIWWWRQSYEWIIHNKELYVTYPKVSILIGGFILLCLIFYILGRLHYSHKKFFRLAPLYFVFAILPLSSILVFLSTENGVFELGKMLASGSLLASWQLTTVIIILTLMLAISMMYAFSRKLLTATELGITIFIMILGISIALCTNNNFVLPAIKPTLGSVGIIWALLFNFAIFLEIMGLLFFGYIRQKKVMVNTGIFLLFFMIFIKYIDWFFDSLDKSIFFIGAGVLLLITGWIMEFSRRYMLKRMQEQKV